MTDGNGWVTNCACGQWHWGRFGAAGILVTDGTHVLLQQRAGWTHQGGTWAVPGGARDSHETPVEAALREAVEETTLDPASIVPVDQWVDQHSAWSYTTVIARIDARPAVAAANAETEDMRWVPLAEVEGLPLHAGFANAWPQLRARVAGHGRPEPLA